MSVSNGCGQLGAIQTRGTCWFYSILNGFILSEDGQKILFNRLKNFHKKLKPAEKAYFDDEFNAPCPMKNLSKTKKIYFWKFIDQYLCFMSGPRAVTLKAGKSASILGKMNLQGTVAKNLGGKGAFPQVEIGKILDNVGFGGEYYVKYASDPPKFHARRKPQFVVVMQSKLYTRAYMDEIPAGLLADPKYKIMCASLVIANTNANSSEMHKWHAVAGFVCNNTGYIYDSNQRKIFKCDWWNLADFKKVANEEIALAYPFFKGGKINVHTYSFAIFARNEFTKDIGAACLMKYKAKTPNLGLSNAFFTDPNSGKAINTRFPQLNPAQRAALKRKWARTTHRELVYVNSATLNSILTGATSRNNSMRSVFDLRNAGYTVKNDLFSNFEKKLNVKFPVAAAKTYTFAEAKAHLNKFKTSAVRKSQYSHVWKGIPIAQRKVLMHYRNTGVWLANNAFEEKAKPPIKRKVKTPTPPIKKESPSPRTKRAIGVKANFEKYWKAIQPENRQMIRNYVSTYKSLSPNTKKLAPFLEPVKKKTPSPSPNKTTALNAAKRHVNDLTTAKARKEYKRVRAVNMSQNNWMELGKYITRKNHEAQAKRAAKKSVAKK